MTFSVSARVTEVTWVTPVMQVFQGMKCIHQFTLDQSWRAAWPLTMLEDPVSPSRVGGTEVELECVLASLKTRDHILARTRGSAPQPLDQYLSDHQEDGGGKSQNDAGQPVDKGKGKGKEQPKGKGKGKDPLNS